MGGGAGEISAVDGSCLLYIVFLPPACGCIFSDFFVCMNFSALPDLPPCLMVRPLESIVRISVRIQDCCAVVRAIAFPEPVLGSVRATDSILTPMERIGIESTLFVYSSTYH